MKVSIFYLEISGVVQVWTNHATVFNTSVPDPKLGFEDEVSTSMVTLLNVEIDESR